MTIFIDDPLRRVESRSWDEAYDAFRREPTLSPDLLKNRKAAPDTPPQRTSYSAPCQPRQSTSRPRIQLEGRNVALV
jgi:hypothetical protein